MAKHLPVLTKTSDNNTTILNAYFTGGCCFICEQPDEPLVAVRPGFSSLRPAQPRHHPRAGLH